MGQWSLEDEKVKFQVSGFRFQVARGVACVVFLLLTAHCSLLAVRAQGTPGTVRFPSQLDTPDSLFRVTDGPRTSLGVTLDAAATSLTTASTGTSGFAASGS